MIKKEKCWKCGCDCATEEAVSIYNGTDWRRHWTCPDHAELIVEKLTNGLTRAVKK